MVQSFLETVGESDAALEEHSDRQGRIPCVRNRPAFRPRCDCFYTDQALARALPDELFAAYRAMQDRTTERRLWIEQNEHFQQQVAEMQQQFQRQNVEQQQEERASAEFLRLRYPNARMCP
eukprot:2039612-Amphidinium_carterae.1